MRSLKLFNAVVARGGGESVFNDELGLAVVPEASWCYDRILAYYKGARLANSEFGKSFHKSWQKILGSTRLELAVHQVLHYLSTYGTGFQGEAYLPAEELDLPEGLPLVVVGAYTEYEMKKKALSMLQSGVALKEETVDDLIGLLDELGHEFSAEDGVRNREAVVKIAEAYGVLPDDPVQFLRLVVYKATGSAVLIKNGDTQRAILESTYNPSMLFKQYGLERLAEVFNRYKPIFLGFKHKCPKTVNRISRLSKVHHKPMAQNPLGLVTSRQLTARDSGWLDSATPFALFRALQACHTRRLGQESFVYRIRNGKSWVGEAQPARDVCSSNQYRLANYLRERFDLGSQSVYMPDGVDYALPTSEKLFVGNLPTGTKLFGPQLAVGVYWRDEWGARDIDLSGLSFAGKVGWNAQYGQGRELLYSGDVTSAPDGAVEYLHAIRGLTHPALLMANIYCGDTDCKYKIVAGSGPSVSRQHMMDPNETQFEVACQSVQKQNVMGMFLPRGPELVEFVVLNFGAGHARVSGGGGYVLQARKALYEQWREPVMLRDVLILLGAAVVSDPREATIDLSRDKLERDTFTKMFE